jgi:uncharacterized tellurite resistance protein B-like protein
MGIFDFLFAKKNLGSEKKETTPHRSSNQTSQNSAETVIIATGASAKESVDSFQKNSNDWSFEEKALLFAILTEIAWADGEMHQKEKSAIAKLGFEAGILNDIMEVQDLANRMYTKSKTEGDLEKIANDFKNLSSVKKEYIVKAVSEMMESDGKTTQDELLIAFQLTGKFSDLIDIEKSVDKFLDSNAWEKMFPNNLLFEEWTCIDGSIINTNPGLNNFKILVQDHLNVMALRKADLNQNSTNETFIKTKDNKKIYDWYPLKEHLIVTKDRYSGEEYDKQDLAMVIEVLRACVFDFGEMKSPSFLRLTSSYFLFNSSIEDDVFLKAYESSQIQVLIDKGLE